MRRATLHYILDLAMALLALILGGSALLLWVIFPRGYYPARTLWVAIHKWGGLALGIAVAVHYYWLSFLSRCSLPRRIPLSGRRRISIAVLGALMAHVVEILVFGIGYFLLAGAGRFGTLEGFDGSLSDSVYFSFVAYTFLGFGDIVPVGQIRFVVVFETILGLVLIAWTASFLFMRMKEYWGKGAG